MRKAIIIAALFSVIAGLASAQIAPEGGGGSSLSALPFFDSRYCKVAGCTPTGAYAFTVASTINANLTLGSTSTLGWGSSGVATPDVFLQRNAANILEQRNAANAQTHYVYNTFTSGSVFERGCAPCWTSNVVEYGSENTGATGRSVRIKAANPGQITFMTAGADSWKIDNGGMLTPVTDMQRTAGSSSLRITDVFSGRSLQNGATLKTLTESAATGFVDISVASGAVIGGQVDWTIEANDATDFQTLTGSTYFSAVNKAGTVTCTVGAIGTAINAVSTGTLTNTMTCTAGTLKLTVNANAVSSLTQTTLRINYYVRVNGTATVTGL